MRIQSSTAQNQKSRSLRTLVKRRGFALIAVLTILSLLAMLAIGMLSLSSVQSRNAGASTLRERAEENARFALMTALAHLQETAGPDQRITANASVFDAGSNNPHYLGVFRSFDEDLNRDAPSEAPHLPGDHYEKSTVERALDDSAPRSGQYGETDGYFVDWLVSRTGDREFDAHNRSLPEDVDVENGGTSVVLVGEGSAGRNADRGGDDRVVAERVPIRNDGEIVGDYAYYVGGLNQKADLSAYDASYDTDNAGVAYGRVGGPSPYALGRIDTQLGTAVTPNVEPLNRAISRETLNLALGVSANSDNLKNAFHDVTAQATSLPVNVAAGGFKKDLTSLVATQTLPRGYQRTDDRTFNFGTDASAGWLSSANRYHLLNWEYLKGMLESPADTTRMESRGRSRFTGKYGDKGNVAFSEFGAGQISPVIVRFSAIFGVSKTPATGPGGGAGGGAVGGGTGGQGATQYWKLQNYFSPVVALWNPYNVPLEVESSAQFATSISPVGFEWQKNGNQNGLSGDLPAVNGRRYFFADGIRVNPLRLTVARDVTIPPGETVLLLARNSATFDQNSTQLEIELEPRDPTSLVWSECLGLPTEFTDDMQGLLDADSIRPRASFVTRETGRTVSSAGWNIHFYPNARLARIDQRGAQLNTGSGSNINRVRFRDFLRFQDYNEIGLPTIIQGKVFPYLAVECFQKTLSRGDGSPLSSSRPNLADFPIKPWVNYEMGYDRYRMAGTDSGFRNVTSRRARQAVYTAPFRVEMLPLQGNFSVGLQFQGEDNSAGERGVYHGGSISPTGGESKVIAKEVPLGPLTSLAQLNRLSLLSQDGLLAGNLAGGGLGNSFASPIMRSDQIYASWNNTYQYNPDVPDNTGLDASNSAGWYDTSYVANSLMFDDYFFSGLSGPRRGLWSGNYRSGIIAFQESANRNNREGRWNNSSYVYDSNGLSDDDVLGRYVQGAFADDESYYRIAEHILIDGGFNVNSTSELAWRHLLGRLNGRSQVEVDARGNVELSANGAGEDNDTVAFFATTVAADASPSNPLLEPVALSDSELDELARSIVQVVRERGPFRSMGEFVNRRLIEPSEAASNPRQALYGVLQQAIEQTSINNDFRSDYATITEAEVGSVNYAFEEAALGSRAQGAPGDLTQANLLQALAPVLTVRDDSFVIRSYGSVRNTSGEIVSEAWIEATVRRSQNYVDPADNPHARPDNRKHGYYLEEGIPVITSSVNERFGRRFEILSIRRLAESEV